MRKLYSFIFGIASIALLMVACNTNKGESGNTSKTIKMDKLDLGNAKYLSLTDVSTRSQPEDAGEVGLFKIDDQGNISAVVLSCVESEDGTVTQVRKDIRVVPRHLISFLGVYTLMSDCDFKTSEEEHFNMRAYYEPGSREPFNILVRNSDGKIFYIPQSANKYFESLENPVAALDAKENLYFISTQSWDLLMITAQNEDLVIKQVNPVGVAGSEIWPLDNGTIIIDEFGDAYVFLYPNGGFETIIPDTFSSDMGQQTYYLAETEDGIKAIQLERRDGTPQPEYVVTLNDYHVGTSVGERSFSPISSISSGTEYSTKLGDANYLDWVSKVGISWKNWIYPLYETSDSYFLGTCLVVDKRTQQITALNWDQSNNVIFPTKDNTYKGLAWNVNSTSASWFDIKTFEHGVVNFDFSMVGAFVKSGYIVDIPSGRVIMTGVRNSDGKQIVCIIDIETGYIVDYSENDNIRPITVLIPLN